MKNRKPPIELTGSEEKVVICIPMPVSVARHFDAIASRRFVSRAQAVRDVLFAELERQGALDLAGHHTA